MSRVTTIVRKPAVKLDRVVDTITLDHEARGKRHAHWTGEAGTGIHLDLDMKTTINDGDALRLEDGRLIQVKAAAEKLLEVRAENPLRLMRLAWHLGSQHGLAEFAGDALYIENNPALAELARGQGCTATPVERRFQPEQSAHHCDHDHGHHHHDHGHKHGHDHGHEHGPGCGHAHDHHKHD
ncbi:MAG: urease accessory protein UreE [Microvirga sp.]|jgi:urease accessory protein|nr:urease accessory protein UreE [Microvirga sp.]